jgi:hypothetical protein
MKAMNPKPPRTRRTSDIAILQGPTEDGLGARVVRVKDGAVSAGEVRPAREGEPLAQRELVRLKPLHAELPICEVEVLHGPAEPAPSANSSSSSSKASPGPARVATDTYRKNWGTVFGAKRKRGDYSVN